MTISGQEKVMVPTMDFMTRLDKGDNDNNDGIGGGKR